MTPTKLIFGQFRPLCHSLLISCTKSTKSKMQITRAPKNNHFILLHFASLLIFSPTVCAKFITRCQESLGSLPLKVKLFQPHPFLSETLTTKSSLLSPALSVLPYQLLSVTTPSFSLFPSSGQDGGKTKIYFFSLF